MSTPRGNGRARRAKRGRKRVGAPSGPFTSLNVAQDLTQGTFVAMLGPGKGNAGVRQWDVTDSREFKAATLGKVQCRFHQITATYVPLSTVDGVSAISVHMVDSLAHKSLEPMLRAGALTKPYSVQRSVQAGGVTDWFPLTETQDIGVSVYTSTVTTSDLYMLKLSCTFSARGAGNFR